LTQTFVESCVDFEVAHLSILMVQRLAYPEIPTLIAKKIVPFLLLADTYPSQVYTGDYTGHFL